MIDTVIERLTQIIQQSQARGSRLGYFPALYRRVTQRVKEGIARHEFEDGPRLERLDVVFAQRYFDAFDQYQAHQTPSGVWKFAFQTADEWSPIVLQHLLLGINAHINLDLGIAAAEIAPGDQLPSLRNDFNRINALLASQVETVENQLSEIWPPLRWFRKWVHGIDKSIINFSLEKARDAAWQFAERLAPLDASERQELINDQDVLMTELGHLIRHPGLVTSTVLRAIRLGERGSVRDIINLLSQDRT